MAVKGYLLDANHVSAWEANDPAFLKRLDAAPPEALPRVCSITLGELEFGAKVTANTAPTRRDRCREFIRRHLKPYAVDITATTAEYYADIMARLWLLAPPPMGRSTDRHLVEIGADVNDIWIAAVAYERGLVLLTHDRMKNIRAAVGSEVQFDDWLISTP